VTVSPPVTSSNENDVFTSPRGIPRGWPATIGPYRLVSLLGRGGMATVFLARHAEGGPDVALKVLDPHLLGKNIHRARERFEREAEVMSRLTHPGIVNLVLKGVHQTGDSMPLLYFVMEFIDGFNAHDLLMRRGRLWLSEAVRITRDAALALGHAHEQGVVHRDIKPSNILWTGRGACAWGTLACAWWQTAWSSRRWVTSWAPWRFWRRSSFWESALKRNRMCLPWPRCVSRWPAGASSGMPARRRGPPQKKPPRHTCTSSRTFRRDCAACWNARWRWTRTSAPKTRESWRGC
jgi:serine/threonine protein kinase